MVDAHFSIDATRLIMKFDSQPTNQAGLGGLGRVSCDLLLDEDTSAVLRGSASLYPDCIWTADEVVAFLTIHTDAAPGMRVGFKPNTIWPAAWSYPGSCAGQGSKCNTAASSQISIQTFFPCDIRHTPTIEACLIPTATIRAPESISSCSNASLMLRVDGLSSSGSGIKPFRFTWGADPISCDNFYPIQAKLEEQNAAQATIITLDSSLLAGGATFVFWLQERATPHSPFLCSSSVKMRMSSVAVCAGEQLARLEERHQVQDGHTGHFAHPDSAADRGDKA
ncbi:MAG: hypothetical protein SGPRY_003992 [Prymnesium sp.]